MRNKQLILSACALLLAFTAYFTSCKKDPAPVVATDLLKPISVTFSRNEILDLLSQGGDNDVAGICFLPMQEADHTNLMAVLAEWNTSENKPNEMVKVMTKSIIGHITNDPCPGMNANGTTEFELAFYDKETLSRFLNEDHYYPGLTQQPSGIYLSRIMLDMSNGNELKKYRGIVMKPYPLPDLTKGYKEREATAYEVAPVCPPIWRN